MVVTKGASSQGTQGYFHIKPPGFKNTVGWAGAHGARGTSLGRLPLSTSQLRSHSHPQAASPAHQCPGPSCSTLPVPQHPELQCCPRSGAGNEGTWLWNPSPAPVLAGAPWGQPGLSKHLWPCQHSVEAG